MVVIALSVQGWMILNPWYGCWFTLLEWCHGVKWIVPISFGVLIGSADRRREHFLGGGGGFYTTWYSSTHFHQEPNTRFVGRCGGLIDSPLY